MRSARFVVAGVALVLMAGAEGLRADDVSPVLAAAKAAKFANLLGLPTCLTAAVLKGDPSKEAAVILLKLSTGCVVPWHWHTAAEDLVMVSGAGKLAMQDGTVNTVQTGDYGFLPEKHVHQFTCAASCLLYDLPQGAFDIHYVDASGNEISAEQALGKPKVKGGPKKALGPQR
jgi:quercetin dioxygenase-like cupin family protein